MPGRDRRVIRVGAEVHRPTGPRSPAIHRLLTHLEAVDFPYAPRFRGIDDEGREILTYIEGDSGPAGWRQVVPEPGLAAFARLLRAYHDAIRGHAGTAGDVMCHGDFGPWNIVWRDGAPVGILDFDHAHPAPPIHDVAYALEYTAPLRHDEECVRWLGYASPPDRRRRVAVFADAYGLGSRAGIVDAVLAAQAWTRSEVRRLAREGVEPQVSWVRDGHLEELARRMWWVEEHRGLF